jgi:hypothetical protein
VVMVGDDDRAPAAGSGIACRRAVGEDDDGHGLILWESAMSSVDAHNSTNGRFALWRGITPPGAPLRDGRDDAQ